MKKIRIVADEQLADSNVIHVTMYWRPTFYEGSVVFSNVTFDPKEHKYHTDINPSRAISGPLSGPGEALEYPLRQELNSFIKDCVFLIKEVGFTIISQETSEDSKKSEYIIMFGMNDDPCGTLVFDLRISDHPFDAKFPEDAKDAALEYLKVNKILDANILKDRINFDVEKVTIGTRTDDSWDKAFTRLYNLLRRLRKRVRVELNNQRNS